MCAEQAFLQKQETGKDFPFSFIQLNKDVFLSLKNKAELRSHSAELDFNELKGSFSSSGDEKVSYKDFLKKEGSAPVPFYLMSRLIDVKIGKQESSSEGTQYEIQALAAKQDVFIEYAQDFTLQADVASYQNSGIIQAHPTSETSKCKLSYQGEQLEAAEITINTKSNQIQLQKPIGSIPSQLFNQNGSGPLFFRCESLSWDHKLETLTLKDQVVVQEKTLGSLFAEKEMIVEQGSFGNKKSVKSLHIDGVSRLEHEDLASAWKHSISCFGALHIDGLKGQITLTSPSDVEKQLCYQDPEVTLHANKALIEYGDPDTFKLLSLTLQGSVSIESSQATGPSRVGIADRLTYYPDTQTAILSALPKKKVLFHDEEQNITMSAQEVHLTQDPATGKIQAKGIGNVSFSLSDHETSLLKTRFPQAPVEP